VLSLTPPLTVPHPESTNSLQDKRPFAVHMARVAMGLAKRVQKLGIETSAKLTRGQGIFGQYEDPMALQPCKAHRKVALISTDVWHPTRPQDGQRTCEHLCNLQVG
jgi:hypothetical protein